MPSNYFKEKFSINTDSKTKENFVLVRGNVRFSILTSQLLRVEVSDDGTFTDEPTQAFLFRNIEEPQFSVEEKKNIINIVTYHCEFSYDIKNKKMLSISVKGQTVKNFEQGNLKGTHRTLDMVDGECKLDSGLISKSGVSIYDDSKSLILLPDGTVKERKPCSDLYFFAYGCDYRDCIRDFYKLSGEVPLVPRFCLGNWWSRYKAYTQKEYLSLMNSFAERQIPISVATVDMDWHWVDVEKRFMGKKTDPKIPLFKREGWTGYSWNTELFPDYKAFLNELHSEGLKVTVNLHPAQGVRFYEDMYAQMAKAMGIDPESKKTVDFDIANPDFIENYFKIVHEPYQKDGVDFWWIDWQQGKKSGIEGLDPLWALNHYHTLALKSSGKRPLILSRYANIGSHRYPLGFSGDTMMTWRSLKFQPYFTANASNAGYTWWSHDIGGHHFGERDDELYLRWLQFGEYSPIMRLHSTNDEFMGKEPWKYGFEAKTAAINALRERHALIPYTYSMNYRTHKDGIAICEPMYYSFPYEEEAYNVPNQYFFGSELLAAPITEHTNKTTNMASVKVWLPQGVWTDIYNGNIYEGGKTVNMYRDTESIPVLAKEGAILPLSKNDRTNDCSNPKDMIVRVFLGNNEFELYEDDGETMNFESGKFCLTTMYQKVSDNNMKFVILPTQGDLSLIPETRNYTLAFENISDAEEIRVKVGGVKTDCRVRKQFNKIYIDVVDVSPREKIKVKLLGFTKRENRDKKEQLTELISKYQMNTVCKKMEFSSFINNIDGGIPKCKKDLRGPIEEILSMP